MIVRFEKIEESNYAYKELLKYNCKVSFIDTQHESDEAKFYTNLDLLKSEEARNASLTLNMLKLRTDS